MLKPARFDHYLISLMTILLMACAPSVFAFGRVDQLAGEVIAIDVDGQTRVLSKDSTIKQSDALVTAKNAEVLIITDDRGLLALRPNSRVVVEAYQAKGNQQDKTILKLLKGSIRSVTGFIGKSAPKNYQIITATATIGVRGTDHEVAVVDEPNTENQIGTYSKVNTGGVYLSTRGITLDLNAGQSGLVPKTGMPQLLDKTPTDLFVKAAIDSRLEALIIQLDPEAKEKLSEKLTEQKAAGGTVRSGESKIPANCGFDTLAQKGLDEFISAYEAGNTALIQRRLDPAMLGYGVFLNSIVEDMNNQKQIRFLIKDRTAQCGSDLASINFRWEKRYLDLQTFNPQLQTGQASILVYLKNGEWKLSGITGDNPFATRLANQANGLRLTPTQVSLSSLPQSCVPGPTSTLTGVATASVNLLEFSGAPTCNPLATPTCSIAGFAGTVTASTLTCSGPPIITGTVYTANGSTPFSSTGPATSTATVNSVIPVNGNSPNGQSANGTYTCSATITYPTGSPVCGVTPTTVPVQLNLTSASQAGAGTAQIEASTTNGDREIFTLTETSRGQFTLSGLPVAGGNAVAGNGRIDLNAPTTITFRFADSKTGGLVSTQFTVTP